MTVQRGQIHRAIYVNRTRGKLGPSYLLIIKVNSYRGKHWVITCSPSGKMLRYGKQRLVSTERLEHSYILHKDSDMTNNASKLRVETDQTYQPRQYPNDTPEVAEARRAAFEAGRQYEASLRQDNPATLIPAAEFAVLSPWVDGQMGGTWCFFCGEDHGQPHKPDCLWVRCGGKP